MFLGKKNPLSFLKEILFRTICLRVTLARGQVGVLYKRPRRFITPNSRTRSVLGNSANNPISNIHHRYQKQLWITKTPQKINANNLFEKIKLQIIVWIKNAPRFPSEIAGHF